MSLSFEAESGEARSALGSPKACVWFPQSPRGFLFGSRGALVGGLDRRWWRWPLPQTSPGCWVEFGWTRVLHRTEMQTDVGWSSGFPTLLSVGSRQGKQADWGGEFQPSWHVGKTEVWFIMHFSSVHKECFFWYQASWGCAQPPPRREIPGWTSPEQLQDCWAEVSVHLPATRLVFVGAKLGKNKA